MKVITTNRLNRFWKNGVLPIKNALANKLNTANVVNNLLTTVAGYALDARQGKALDDKITALNGKTTTLDTKGRFNGQIITPQFPNGAIPIVGEGANISLRWEPNSRNVNVWVNNTLLGAITLK